MFFPINSYISKLIFQNNLYFILFFSVTTQLHESLILEYGSLLMGHHSLWQCGVSYLEHCPLQGLSRLEILLQSIPLGNEAKINKIIELARDHKMHSVG